MKKLLVCLLLIFSFNAGASPQPLKVDQAFQLTATAKDNQTLITEWTIAPGYYLYRARIHIVAMNPEISHLAEAIMPEGINKTDPELGNYQVYENTLKVIIPIRESSESSISLSVDYQGCSEFGYCYPPTTKVLRINLNDNYGQSVQPLNIDIAPKTVATISKQDKISLLLSNQHPIWVLLAFLGFGLLIALTPCVLPMIPILSSIILGQKKLDRRHSFLLSLSYVFGMALTYAAIGVVFALIGKNLQTFLQTPPVIIGLSLIFIAMSLSLFGLYELQVPLFIRNRIHSISEHQRRGSYLGAAVMGILSTLIVSPCVTAPLVGALGFISQSGNLVLGGASLFVMGIGMGAPLLVIGATGHLFLKTGPWMNRIKQLLGLLMLGVAIYMLSHLISSEANSDFIPVKTIEDVEREVSHAAGKPVLLDFYADWCVACKEMDRLTFNNAAVHKKLKSWVLLRADVTANDDQDKALTKNYHIIAPPSLVFFDTEGKNIAQASLVGEVSANELLQKLEGIQNERTHSINATQ